MRTTTIELYSPEGLHALREYPLIAPWHRSSMPYYVEGLARKAQADGAPRTAIYHNGERWVLASEVQNPSMLAVLFHAAIVAQPTRED